MKFKFFLSLFFFLLAISSPVQSDEEGFVVKDIRVSGLQRISVGTVFNYLPVNVGEILLQKNIGPAGLGFAIIKKDLLNKAQDITPTMLNYSTMLEGESMYNTPPTFAWYVAGKVFKWLKSIGGVEAMGEINHRKANKLYSFIDESNFYSNNIKKPNRSIMNIPFLLGDDNLNKLFLEESEEAGLLA